MAGQPTTLASVGLEVAHLFSDLVSVERLIGDDKHPERSQSLFRAEYDRFELWAVNLGLFIPGHGSLDYRVRDAPSLRGALMRFIVDLKDSLSQVLEYGHGSVDVMVSLQSGDLDHDVDDGMSPSPLLLGDDSSSFELVGEVDSDIDLFLDSIKDPIDRLYKLSTRIRNPITRFGSSKARQYRKIDPDSNCDLLQAFQPFDQDYVSSLLLQYWKSSAAQLSPPQAPPTEPEDEGDTPTYPDNVWEPFRSLLARYNEETSRGEESFLVRRLAQANIQRRKQFGYWMRHREKLVLHSRFISQEVQLPVGVIRISDEPMAQAAGNTAAQQTVPGDLSVTTATRLQAAQLAVRDDQSTVSVSEYAPSTYVGDDSPEFPVPPKIEDGQKYFECPYCFTLCPSELLRPKAWRAHLIRDMRPYVCTYEDCCNPDQLYDTRQDWIEHEGSCHRKVWRCPDHIEQYFTSVDSLRHHLADGHVTGIATASNDFTRASESVLTLADRCCPICQFSTEMATGLQKHIAIHLERIALFSLPRSAGDDDDDDAGSESVNPPDGDSREDDNSDDFRFDADEDDGDSDDGSGQPVRSAAEKARRRWKLAIDAVCKGLGSDVNTRLSQSSSWKSPLHAMRAEAEELVQQGRLRQAEELYDNILDARRRALGSHHPRTLTSMSDLASVYEQQGLKQKADELLAQVAEVRLLLSANSQEPARYLGQQWDTMLFIHDMRTQTSRGSSSRGRTHLTSPLECPLCAVVGLVVSWQRPAEFTRHLKEKHPPKEVYLCPHQGCSLAFDRRWSFSEHCRKLHRQALNPSQVFPTKLQTQKVFACGFSICKAIFEADSDADAGEMHNAYISHISDHLKEDRKLKKAPKPEWHYAVYLKNLMRQKDLKDLWKRRERANPGFKWQPQPHNSYVLMKIVETRSYYDAALLVQCVDAVGYPPYNKPDSPAFPLPPNLSRPLEIDVSGDSAHTVAEPQPNDRARISMDAPVLRMTPPGAYDGYPGPFPYMNNSDVSTSTEKVQPQSYDFNPTYATSAPCMDHGHQIQAFTNAYQPSSTFLDVQVGQQTSEHPSRLLDWNSAGYYPSGFQDCPVDPELFVSNNCPGTDDPMDVETAEDDTDLAHDYS